MDFNSAVDLNAISEDGVEYNNDYVACPEPKIDVKIYQGASNEGWAAFLVKKDDLHPRIVLG